ncbi:hypothetical protein [Streptomyces sp. NPDC094472]|uniref:hypothetical protein n=1 Tax=unclassified Streptomyces TaxID=2593676 RepID=UPI003321C097
MIPGFGQELGVMAEQNLNALPGPARALRGVDSGSQPEQDACMAQVIGTLRAFHRLLVKGESSLTRSPPRKAMRRGFDVVPRRDRAGL